MDNEDKLTIKDIPHIRPNSNISDEPVKKKQKLNSLDEEQIEEENELQKMIKALNELKDNIILKWNSLSKSSKIKLLDSSVELSFLSETEKRNLSLYSSLKYFMKDYEKYNFFNNCSMDISGEFEEAGEYFEKRVWGNIGPITFSHSYNVRYGNECTWKEFNFDHVSESESEYFELYISDKDKKKSYKKHVKHHEDNDIDEDIYNDFCCDFISFLSEVPKTL